MDVATALVGAVAFVVSVAFAWPQALATFRSERLDGVSTLTVTLMWGTTATWATYGILRADPVLVAANGIAAVATVVTLVGLDRAGALDRRVAGAGVAAWAAVLGPAAVWADPAAVGVLGSALGLSMAVPQGSRAIRHGAAGVSITTYRLLAAIPVTWLAYGVLIGDAIVIYPNVAAAGINAAVLVAVTRAHRRT